MADNMPSLNLCSLSVGESASVSVSQSILPSSNMDILKFMRWNSRVDDEFWQRFAELKLDTLGLDQNPINIQGFFAPCSHSQIPSYLQLRFASLPSEIGQNIDYMGARFGHRNQCSMLGTLYNTNTEESFRTIDKQALLKTETQKVWDDICSGKAEENSSLLNRFFLISYADLKKWRFYYWFGFPGIVLNPPFTSSNLQSASKVLSVEEGVSTLEACNNWRASPLSGSLPFFLLHSLNGTMKPRPLREWTQCQQEGGKVVLVFYDPSNLNTNPGWPLRNLLALAAVRWRPKTVRVLCYRERCGQADLEWSLVGDITLPKVAGWKDHSLVADVVGWEPNTHGKMGPRMADLSSSMDPVRMATSAADLNLKLMRWRLLPSLDMALLSKTKCLLLGAGTLGCQVARGLLAWGFRHITFVDSGRVAMSNPLRQSLYTFQDCLNGGKPKASAAAENLKQIFPGVISKGVQLAISMPGHRVLDSELQKAMEDCDLLKALIDEHDAVFLLTDTRESRWLPTLLCANANKVTITAALGFDTFLVMRHGTGPSVCSGAVKDGISYPEQISGCVKEAKELRLGCYFCNDVVAPNDSTMNRTLDQQCTVTRPGIAPIAAALAVELTVSILHHPLRVNAPADGAIPLSSPTIQPLGIVPHQIRGFASHFAQSVFVGNAFDKCSACSTTVVSEFRRRGFDFLLQIFNHPTFLEDITGLSSLLLAADSISVDWEDECDNSSGSEIA
eukprot:c27801_g1_i1 orf=95-2290(+)